MPYYRRTYRQKYPFRRRRRYYRRKYRKPTMGSLTSKLKYLGLAKESKFHSVVNSALAILSTGSIVSISDIGQGDTINTRDGNQCRVRAIYGKYFISQGAESAIQNLRHMIIIDKSPDGTAPTLSEILQDATAGDSLVSGLNITNVSRFRVLYNRVYRISDSGNANDKYIKFYKKCNIQLNFQGAGSASQVNQKIYEVFLSDVGADGPTITSDLRLRFYG